MPLTICRSCSASHICINILEFISDNLLDYFRWLYGALVIPVYMQIDDTFLSSAPVNNEGN